MSSVGMIFVPPIADPDASLEQWFDFFSRSCQRISRVGSDARGSRTSIKLHATALKFPIKNRPTVKLGRGNS